MKKKSDRRTKREPVRKIELTIENDGVRLRFSNTDTLDELDAVNALIVNLVNSIYEKSSKLDDTITLAETFDAVTYKAKSNFGLIEKESVEIENAE